jgi:fatty acid desaturase
VLRDMRGGGRAAGRDRGTAARQRREVGRLSDRFEPTEPYDPSEREPFDPARDGGAEPHDPSAEARRKLMRHATLYMYGSILAALFLALAGAALIAFLLRGIGWPFLRLWLVIVAIVLVPPLLAIVVRALRQPRNRQ